VEARLAELSSKRTLLAFPTSGNGFATKSPTQTVSRGLRRRSARWCGTLHDRQAVTERRRPNAAALAALDSAVANLGAEAVKAYEAGRAAAQQVMKDLDKQIADEATPDPKRFALRQERIKLPNYAAFPLDAEVQQLVNRLDE
jgi:hypothetical protein